MVPIFGADVIELGIYVTRTPRHVIQLCCKNAARIMTVLLPRHVIKPCCKNVCAMCLMYYHVNWDVSILSVTCFEHDLCLCAIACPFVLVYTPISVRDE